MARAVDEVLVNGVEPGNEVSSAFLGNSSNRTSAHYNALSRLPSPGAFEGLS
jgi:hypothetical protein